MKKDDVIEILSKLNQLDARVSQFEVRLSRLETKIEDLLGNGYGQDVRDHERRIRFLERGFWTAFGALALFQLILKLIPLPWGGQ